jgi:hypothetical protein
MEHEPTMKRNSSIVHCRFIISEYHPKMIKLSFSLLIRSIGVISLLLMSGNLNAETLEKGNPFPDFEATDQHEVDYPIPGDTQFVAVTFDMSTGKKANKFFSEKGKDYLPENNAVFLSNIDGMPAIARVFAMPKMRKYPHRIMLADQEGLLDPFPQEKGMVTILTLDKNRKILDMKFWDPESGTEPFKQ